MDNMLGLKIRKVRELRNYSQNYVADKLLMSQSNYSDIESGKAKISDQRLSQIATVLEVDPEIIKSFSENVVFNSCTQSGYSNTYHINPIEKIDALYNEIIVELKNQLLAQKETIKAKDELIKILLENKK